jgi:hypothetical protein
MNKTIIYHTDPAHGWLEVTAADVQALGIAGQISNYSYRKGDACYLEEDCDAFLFMETAKGAGWTVNVTTRHTDRDSFIRALPRFA